MPDFKDSLIYTWSIFFLVCSNPFFLLHHFLTHPSIVSSSHPSTLQSSHDIFSLTVPLSFHFNHLILSSHSLIPIFFHLILNHHWSINVRVNRVQLSPPGRNEKGQLGIGDTEVRAGVIPMDTMSEFTVVAAAVGRNHTLLLTDRGSVFACGDNKSGQCGVGNTTAVLHTPSRISFKEGKVVKVCVLWWRIMV